MVLQVNSPNCIINKVPLLLSCFTRLALGRYRLGGSVRARMPARRLRNLKSCTFNSHGAVRSGLAPIFKRPIKKSRGMHVNSEIG